MYGACGGRGRCGVAHAGAAAVLVAPLWLFCPPGEDTRITADCPVLTVRGRFIATVEGTGGGLSNEGMRGEQG